MKPIQTFTAVVLSAGFVGSASASTTLFDLIDTDGSVTVGDKLFFDFTYLATGDMPDAADIDVVDHIDIDGNFGLSFQGAFMDLAGGGASDALITFEVAVLDPGMLISEAHLAGTITTDGVGGSFGAVTETFLTANTTDSMTIFANASASQNTDWVVFSAPVSTLSVQKDILLFAGDGSTGVVLTSVEQSFSQVPEPGSLALMGLGVLALLRRRR